jgi:hypothetical protein
VALSRLEEDRRKTQWYSHSRTAALRSWWNWRWCLVELFWSWLSWFKRWLTRIWPIWCTFPLLA